VQHVATRGALLKAEIEAALAGIGLVGEVRGHGFLLGIDYVDPRDGQSFLPRELKVAGRIDRAAEAKGLLVLSTQPTGDGFAGDQSLFAPAFVTPEADLAEMVRRFSAAVAEVAEQIEPELERQGSGSSTVREAGVP
jgi:adenosylmethionine-8-amino-7-oxononanoate aminotransferase